MKPKPDIFVTLCKTDLGISVEKEYRFHPTRKWRFDYAIPAYKIAVEVEGGVWTQGRHTRPQGFLGDMEKYNTATLMGWRVFRTTPNRLLSFSTRNLIKSALCAR
ncbi:MAG: endonuclease domain-containing protein [Bacteroides sp.]|nr:endonuclease domain-containing protein [Bacteroides sp.]